MKLLLDSCVSPKVGSALAEVGHDVELTLTWEKDPGDEVILNYAHEHSRTLITLDKDFGELAILRRLPHSGIVRLVNLSLKQQAPICERVLTEYGEELEEGAIVTAYADRVRIRPVEDE